MPAAKFSKSKDVAKKVAPARKPENKKEKKVFRDEDNLRVYIFRVLKEVHPETGISKTAISTLNSIILEVYRNLAANARELCMKSDHKILTPQDIQTAIKIVFPGEICKHAINEGTRALTTFNSQK